MQEKIDALIAELSSLKDHLAELGDIKEAHNKAESDLAETTAALESAKAELQSGTAGLTEAQIKNKAEHDQAIYDKRKELESLAAQTEKAHAVLGEVQANVNSATIRHKQIEDSLASMKAKFA